MYISANSFDDLLRESYTKIREKGKDERASKGSFREITGVVLELTNPLSRLSLSVDRGRIFSALGEFIWYISGRDDLEFIEYYIKKYNKFTDNPTSENPVLNGAYGKRLFGNFPSNRFFQVAELLKIKSSSRQAVIQIYDNSDMIKLTRDVPCTCTMQFLVRDGKLDLIVYMRSNDAYYGLPHDLFSFTMMQEIMSILLDVELGSYKHMVGSFHLYSNSEEHVESYLSEGHYDSTVFMPAMSSKKNNILTHLRKLIDSEQIIRTSPNHSSLDLPAINDYWNDLLIILEAYKMKGRHNSALDDLVKRVKSDYYSPYIIAAKDINE